MDIYEQSGANQQFIIHRCFLNMYIILRQTWCCIICRTFINDCLQNSLNLQSSEEGAHNWIKQSQGTVLTSLTQTTLAGGGSSPFCLVVLHHIVLQVLLLQSNNISSIGAELQSLRNLTELDLSQNHFTQVHRWHQGPNNKHAWGSMTSNGVFLSLLRFAQWVCRLWAAWWLFTWRRTTLRSWRTLVWKTWPVWRNSTSTTTGSHRLDPRPLLGFPTCCGNSGLPACFCFVTN